MNNSPSETLTITDVKDDKSNTVLPDGYTLSPTLTLFGTSLFSGDVEIYDNDTLIASLTPNPEGFWSLDPTAFGPGKHVLQARATEGDPVPVSTPWPVTILSASDAPIITSAIDTLGYSCPPGTVLTRSFGITFYGRCFESSKQRRVLLDSQHGKFGMIIPAHATTWRQLTSINTPVGYNNWRFIESDVNGLISNSWPLIYQGNS